MSAQHPFHPALDTRDPRGDARRVRLSPWAAPGGRGEAAPPPGARLSIRPVRKLRRAAASISLAGAKPAEFARPAGYLLFLPLPAVLFFSSSLFFFFLGGGAVATALRSAVWMRTDLSSGKQLPALPQKLQPKQNAHLDN